MLLWIHCSLSPQEIRDRIMKEDYPFQQALVSYLESSHQAEFMTGDEMYVRGAVGLFKEGFEPEVKPLKTADYKNPTQTLPEAPPMLCNRSKCAGFCIRCKRSRRWMERYREQVDDLVLRSNLHEHLHSVEDERKMKPERKGCLTKTGVCRARFPREVMKETVVGDDGYVSVRHQEPMLNTTNHVVTYLNRCNSDVTSLLSGTAVKAVISYVSDYISKISLKSYQLFASLYDVFTNKSEYLNGDDDEKVTAVDLLRKMVNSLSSKMEIGSPMASMYVLGNPDSYASHKYIPFPWRSYVSFVRNFWANCDDSDSDNEQDVEKLTVEKDVDSGDFIATSGVDDYRFRPLVFENVNLYEWIQCGDKRARTSKQRIDFQREIELRAALSVSARRVFSESSSGSEDDDFEPEDLLSEEDDSCSDWETEDDEQVIVKKQKKLDRGRRARSHPFLVDHPRYKSHSATCDFQRMRTFIPNFIGGALPRSDRGDRSYYCLTMLTLFKPWRSPGDLKDIADSWEYSFRSHQFTERQISLMQNFNVRYECNDARDDHFAQMRKKLAEAESGFTSHYPHRFMGEKDVLADDAAALHHGMDEHDSVDDDDDDFMGPRTKRLRGESREIRDILRASGWMKSTCGNLQHVDTDRLLPPHKTRSAWSALVKSERSQLTANKLMDMPSYEELRRRRTRVLNTVEILPYTYFDRRTALQKSVVIDMQTKVVTDFELNEEQRRAFMLLANHASQ
ncbi:hypothetical protein B0H16DRAFT_1344639, partial [Mycena metata]